MWELARFFLRMGFTAFGGPAAHIAMLHDEVVIRRGWVSEQHFLDMLGATNLIPGPNSTEMMLHVGYVRAGWRGLLVAGLCFISPAMLIVLTLAWLYVEYGSTPQAAWLLYGVKPVVIALIAQALWSLGRKAVKDAWLLGLSLLVLGAYLFGAGEIPLLLAGGVLVMLVRNLRGGAWAAMLAPLTGGLGGLSLPALAAPFSLGAMFLFFLKVGSVLFGSGYLLLAFLRGDLVTRFAWLTDQQLIDAVAVGQLTPGPILTTATFIGYVLGDLPGALLATLGIFLPSFIFVLITNPLVPRLRRSPWAGGFLDGVNVAALALMAAVTWQLGQSALVDAYSLLLALAATVALFRYKVNSLWLVLGGATAGWLGALLGLI
jgi:chromate transporter